MNPSAIQSILFRIKEISSLPMEKIQTETGNNRFLKQDSGFKEILQNHIDPSAIKPEIQGIPAQIPKIDPLDAIIQTEAKKRDLDPDLIRAVIKAESGFNPQAVSSKGAEGLMQLMPKTSSMLGVNDPFNPKQNISGGTEYLQSMFKKFGSMDKSLAAYNAGPGSVQKFGGVPPYKETKEYVERIGHYYDEFKKGK